MIRQKISFINREISWLYFNQRVLQEAADPNNPLLERLKFLGIYSNNLDEFFRVRVATINRIIDLEEDDATKRPKKILEQIYKFDKVLQVKFDETYREIKRNLEKENIYFLNEKQLNQNQGSFVKQYFHEKVRPNLFPLMLNQMSDNALLRDNSIYLAVCMKSSQNKDTEDFSLIKVPTLLPRFIELPSNDNKIFIIFLDDVIRYCLDEIFQMFDYNFFEAYTIKFTRDAELDIDNDVSKSFLEIMTESLEQRKMGQPVRFIHDRNMPQGLLDFLMKKLQISEKDKISSSGRYHNFKDFIAFPKLPKAHLYYQALPPLPHKDLVNAKSIFSVLNQKDVMLHFPFHSFQHLIDWLREASIDPKVKSIKITIYRVAKDSSVLNALINAARNGKRVTVFMELQARFDEKTNIRWTERLQEEGVQILHGIPGLKVHSKLVLVKRQEQPNLDKYYAYIGTGNFNEDTAKVYADAALLTSDNKITQEVDKVFGLFENQYKPVRFQALIVSPFSQRNFFINRINKEIANVKAGGKGRIVLKLNNLVDERIARKLYLASQAGVKIQLIIRGICILIPGIKDISDNISAFSIVDRFLEHARILYFYNNGADEFYISSADWMVRNFDNRIEVGCPINDKSVKEELRTMLDIQLSDNHKARLLNIKKMNTYKNGAKKKVRAQYDFYGYLKSLLTDN